MKKQKPDWAYFTRDGKKDLQGNKAHNPNITFKKLRDCKDGQVIKFSPGGVCYKVIKKFGRSVMVSSVRSERSYWKEGKLKVYGL